MNAEKIKIVLADDHSMVRDALAQVLQETNQFEVLATAGDSLGLEKALKNKGIEILLIDYSMPGVDCLKVTEDIVNNKSGIRILFFSFNKNASYAVKALNAGALGYVVKSDDIDELILALKKVYEGKSHVSSSISSEVIQKLTTTSAKKEGLEQLSPREFEFISKLSEGHSLSNIALLMGISTSTASTYRSRILEKLNLKTTVDLIKFALDHGIK
jgi:DNA-binding NarL/FixJ family response regulator